MNIRKGGEICKWVGMYLSSVILAIDQSLREFLTLTPFISFYVQSHIPTYFLLTYQINLIVGVYVPWVPLVKMCPFIEYLPPKEVRMH